jgi:hypothetical protein
MVLVAEDKPLFKGSLKKPSNGRDPRAGLRCNALPKRRCRINRLPALARRDMLFKFYNATNHTHTQKMKKKPNNSALTGNRQRQQQKTKTNDSLRVD